MSIELLHLRKILRIMYATEARTISLLRTDIREDIARDAGTSGGGGDFYGPFWRDAKDHTIGIVDLHDSVDARISANSGRSNLYRALRDGFLLWWNERRRWTNEPFQSIQSPKARFDVPGARTTVKIENFLSVVGSAQDRHFVYPYFSPDPALSEEAARLALWVISASGVLEDMSELRILDVIRGQSFSLASHPLRGDEAEIFQRKFELVSELRTTLEAEY